MPATRSGASSPKKALSLPPLPDVVLEPIVKLALQEDLGVAGDVTSDALIDPELQGHWALAAREAGVVAGLDAGTFTAWMIDSEIEFSVAAGDAQVFLQRQLDDWLQHHVRQGWKRERLFR